MKYKLTAIIISCFLYTTIQAQSDIQNDLPLKYLVQEPSIPSAHPPVIILLHGYGSNEADLFSLKDNLPKNLLVISVRAPLPLARDAYQWYRSDNITDIKNSSKAIKSFITAVIKKYHADSSQVYLSGFSQGAMMSYEVGLTSPELLKGIAPLSGKIFESLKPQVQSSAALKKLKIFIGHGDADNRVAYNLAVDAVAYLKKLQLSPEFHTYKGMQHSINEEELKDLAIFLNK
jgi:phospholipase/carboxylesterase